MPAAVPFLGRLAPELASPAAFYRLAGRLVPWCAGAALGLTLLALALGFALDPGGTGRGEAMRIVFVHVPAAWTSLLLYYGMAAWAALGLAGAGRAPALMMAGLVPAGMLFTCMALWTGWMLGKPSLRGGWVWDAQLACEAILFALYAAVLALRSACADAQRADRASAVLVLVGALNLPFVYFSLRWWDGLHESAGRAAATPAASAGLVAGMVVLALAFCMYAQTVALARVRFLMVERAAGRRVLRGEPA